MVTIRDTLMVKVGYSDHSVGIEASIAAVALGAEIIEKHITLDCSMDGPDHRASLQPEALKIMVQSIRNVEKALGNGHKVPSAGELKNRLVVRKSIVASRPIKKAELFSEKNITVKRPGTGISPMRWDDLIGQPAAKSYKIDDLITE
jgi:N,N'-diacetyllegionaminate synthase